MNFSYFEINGTIVECIVEDDYTSHPSPQSTVSVVERPERGRNSTKNQASMMPQTSSLPRYSTGNWLELDDSVSERDRKMHKYRAMRSVLP